MSLHISDLLSYSTVRIECETADDLSVGTGLLFEFDFDGGARTLNVVTNWHVASGAHKTRFALHRRDSDGNPIASEFLDLSFDGADLWTRHPDPEVDLCSLNITGRVMQLERSGELPFKAAFGSESIITTADVANLSAIEEVYFIGYPEGLWDSVHRLPVFRRAVTATSLGIDHGGAKEFLIDAACHLGSSGSPVLMFAHGLRPLNTESVATQGNSVRLLGVLSSVPQLTIDGGKVTRTAIPVTTNAAKSVMQSGMPLNFGYVIKASRIVDLRDSIEEKLRRAGKLPPKEGETRPQAADQPSASQSGG